MTIGRVRHWDTRIGADAGGLGRIPQHVSERVSAREARGGTQRMPPRRSHHLRCSHLVRPEVMRHGAPTFGRRQRVRFPVGPDLKRHRPRRRRADPPREGWTVHRANHRKRGHVRPDLSLLTANLTAKPVNARWSPWTSSDDFRLDFVLCSRCSPPLSPCRQFVISRSSVQVRPPAPKLHTINY